MHTFSLCIGCHCSTDLFLLSGGAVLVHLGAIGLCGHFPRRAYKKTHCWCIVIHRCWPLALSGPSACVRWLFGEARCSRVMLYRSANRLLCVWTLILVAFPCSFHCYWPGLLVCLYRGYGKKVLHRYPLVIDSIRLHP